MKYSLIKLLALVFSLGLYSMTVLAQEKEDQATVTDSKKSIIVQKNSPFFKVVLSSNPSTGYSWFLVNDYSPAIIPIEHHYEPAKDYKLGASGFEKWEFRIKSDAFVVPELLNFRLVYMRPWQAQKPVKEVNFRVITQAKDIDNKNN